MTTLTDTLAFTVPGTPRAKGNIRAFVSKRGRTVYTDGNPHMKPWESAIRVAAFQAMERRPLVRHSVEVELTFFFARPKSHMGTGRNALRVRAGAPQEMTQAPDVDKLARAVLDAMAGVVYENDAQVTDLYASKRWGEPERVEVRLR